MAMIKSVAVTADMALTFLMLSAYMYSELRMVSFYFIYLFIFNISVIAHRIFFRYPFCILKRRQSRTNQLLLHRARFQASG